MTEQQGKAACERIMRHTPAPWAIDLHSLNIWQDSAEGYVIGTLRALKDKEELQANMSLVKSATDMLHTLIELEKCLSNADDRPYERELIKKVLDKATKP